MAVIAPAFKLNDGSKIPAVGLGTFQGAYTYQSMDKEVIRAVCWAVDTGYRMFDTAWLYNTENAVGKALNKKIKQGVVTREELYVVTKLWCTSHAKDEVIPALKRSLKELEMDYVDLFLVHWPMSMPRSDSNWPEDSDGKVLYNDDQCPLKDTWKGMEECVNLGLTRSIGVSNYNKRQIVSTLEDCTIKPVVNQVERHPFFGNKELVEFCSGHDIHITCYSPLGKAARPWAKEGEPVVSSDSTLVALGKKHNKLPTQIALRYQFQRGLSTVPKSSNEERLKHNINIFDFELSKEDMDKVAKLDQNFQMVRLEDRLGHSKEYPFTTDF